MLIPPAAARVLAAINRFARVTQNDHDGKGQWFHLESAELKDRELYLKLRTNWNVITAPNSFSFALIYCESGPDSGVWMHYLGTPEDMANYLPGCHQIPSW